MSLNVIEPAFFGVPVIVGPYIENFEYEIRRMELIEILYIETTTLSLVEKLSTILGGEIDPLTSR